MEASVRTELRAWVDTAPEAQLVALRQFLRSLSGVTPAAPSALVAPPRFAFQKVGADVWLVVYDGAEAFHIEDTLGARYLNHLLHHPNETVSAFDLEIAITPEKGRARDRQTIQPGLDGDTVRTYLRELERLRAERDRAEETGDCGQAQRLEEDIAAIEAELKSGGRSVDTGERARGNVSKAVNAVRKRLLLGNRAERAFAEHISTTISLGYQCLYIQPEGAIWK